MKRINKKIFLIFLIFLLFILKKESLSLECPEKTTVKTQNSVVFVLGVADMGGDTEAKVWFEYGTSSGNYSFQTEKLTVYQTGKYCLEVSNLTPCTTYYYRAAMENKAGPSFGEEKTITLPCQNQVLGAATQAPTGKTKKILIEFLFFPFLVSFLVLILFSRFIFDFENWLNSKKIEIRKITSQKILEAKIAKEKVKKLYQQKT